jgi:RND family efflux transporter MFP subunit
VEPGEVLAEIAVPELQEEAKQKQASVHLAEAEVDQANKALAAGEAAIAVAQAMVVEAQANFERWESESKRMVGLVKGGVVDTQARDETLFQLQSASGKLASSKAVVEKAKADRDRAEADLRASKSRVDVAKADALRSEAMLAYAQIRAPYDGIVTWRRVNTGNFVQPVAGQGDWLFKVAQVNPVRVVVGVPEMDAELVKEKAEARISIQALPGRTFRGTVSRTSWALEPGARTLRAEIDLPNKEGLITPGMYAYAQVVCQLPEAWTLPTTSVAKQGDALVCFVIDGGTAKRTPVQLGRSDGQSVVVLKKQTSSSPAVWEDVTGAEVIVARAAGLTDGQAVQAEASGK